MRIHQFEGGGIAPITVEFVPGIYSAPATGVSSTTADSKKSESDASDVWGLLDKDARTALRSKALHSELVQWLPQAKQFLEGMTDPITGELIGFSSHTKLRLLEQLNLLEQSKNAVDEAEKTASQRGALGEIAIATDGTYFALGPDGQPHRVSQVKPGMRLLTNQELIEARRFNSAFGFNQDITNAIANAASMEDVTKEALSIISHIKPSTESVNYFVDKQSAMRTASLKALVQAGPDGYYKVGEEKSSATKDNIESALRYIYSELKPNQRALLAAKASQHPYGELGMLNDLIQSSLYVTGKRTIDFDSGATNSELARKKQEEELKHKLTNEEAFVAGYGNKESFVLNPGTSLSMRVTGTKGTVLVGSTPIDIGAKASQLEVSNLSGSFDLNNVTMGGVRIDKLALPNIALSGGSTIYGMYLPFTRRNDGSIAPVVGQLKNIEKAESEIKQQGLSEQTDQDKINRIYQGNGLEPKYVRQGNSWVINAPQYKLFGVMQGVAYASAFTDDDGGVLDSDQLDGTVRRLNGRDRDHAGQLLEGIGADNDTGFFSMETIHRMINGGDTIYQGSIYIPMNSNPFNDTAVNGNGYDYSVAPEMQGRHEQTQRVGNYQQSGNLSQHN